MAREAVVWVVAAVWLTLIGIGLWYWERHEATPGATGASAPGADEPNRARWHLTAFLHPRCPCSRATLHELSDVAGASPELSVRVVFVRPAGAPDGWERGDSWELAKRIGGAEVTCDAGGDEGRRYGAETSGFALLRDPDGRVVFRGGLTPARGRVGESVGRRAVLAWLRGGEGAPTAPVFGCPLFSPEG